MKDAAISTAYNVIAIAVDGNNGKVVFNPGGERTLETGDILIVMGSHDDLKKLQKTGNPSGVVHNPHRTHGT